METFASFNYVNEMAAMIQTLKRDVAALEVDCAAMKARSWASTVNKDAEERALKESWTKLETELAAVKVVCVDGRRNVMVMLI